VIEMSVVKSPTIGVAIEEVPSPPICAEHPRLRKAYERAKARGYEKTAERIKHMCDRLERKSI